MDADPSFVCATRESDRGWMCGISLMISRFTIISTTAYRNINQDIPLKKMWYIIDIPLKQTGYTIDPM